MPQKSEGTFRDDRGEPRVVKPPALVTADERMGDPLFALAVRRAMTLRPTLSRKSVMVLLTRMLPWAAVAVVAGIYSVPVWLSIVIAFPFAMLLGRLWPARIEDTLSPRLATHWRGIGLCPCCLYGLAEIPPAQDGNVVCPECGGAWRQARLHGSGHFESRGAGLTRAVATARAYGAQMQQGVFLKDARGTRVPMAVTVLADRLEETHDPDLRERLSRGVRIVRRSGRILRWAVAAFFAGLGLLVL